MKYDHIRIDVEDCDCCGLNIDVYIESDEGERFIGCLGSSFSVQEAIDLASTPENVETPT